MGGRAWLRPGVPALSPQPPGRARRWWGGGDPLLPIQRAAPHQSGPIVPEGKAVVPLTPPEMLAGLVGGGDTCCNPSVPKLPRSVRATCRHPGAAEPCARSSWSVSSAGSSVPGAHLQAGAGLSLPLSLSGAASRESQDVVAGFSLSPATTDKSGHMFVPRLHAAAAWCP